MTDVSITSIPVTSIRNLKVGLHAVTADITLGVNDIGEVMIGGVKLDRKAEEVQSALEPLERLMREAVIGSLEQAAAYRAKRPRAV